VLPRCSLAFHIQLGTLPVNPAKMTGHFAIPRFRPMAEMTFAELPCRDHMPLGEASRFVSDEARVRKAHRRLTRDRIAPVGGDPSLRSASRPIWLLHPDGSACACIEDYALGKRLYEMDGAEVRWRHVSFLGLSNADHATELLAAGLTLAGRDGAPSVRLITDRSTCQALVGVGEGAACLIPATAWGFTPLPLPKRPWTLNASEL
jgi:hypothetical protein